MGASGKMWNWAWLLMGDGSKRGRGGRDNCVPGREVSKCQDLEAREKNEYL